MSMFLCCRKRKYNKCCK